MAQKGLPQRGRRRFRRGIRQRFADRVRRRDGGRRVNPGRDPRRSLNAVRKGGARPHHRYGDDRRKRQGLYFLGDTSGDFSGDDNRPLKAAGAGNDSACAR